MDTWQKLSDVDNMEFGVYLKNICAISGCLKYLNQITNITFVKPVLYMSITFVCIFFNSILVQNNIFLEKSFIYKCMSIVFK